MLEVWSFWKDGDTAISRVWTMEKAQALYEQFSRDPDCLGADILEKEWRHEVPTYRSLLKKARSSYKGRKGD